MAKPALGRGLGALLGGAPKAPGPVSVLANNLPATAAVVVPNQERVQRLALDRLRPCPFQPRKEFSREALQELADSIREQGIIQPLIVREKDGYFELIAGERRWRAAQVAGLTEVAVVVWVAADASVLA